MYTWFQPIITLLSGVLTHIYALTHDWGIAVIVLTFVVKTVLFRLNMAAARNQVRSAAARPELIKVKETYPDDANRQMAETAKVYRTFGIRPFAAMFAAIVQMPVLAAMYGLFLTHGHLMTSALIPWVLHLAQADPLHVLPLASGALTFITGLIPLVETSHAPVPSIGKRAGMALIVMLVPLFITWRSPIALCLYWLASSAFQLAERAFYRTPFGRRWLANGLPGSRAAS